MSLKPCSGELGAADTHSEVNLYSFCFTDDQSSSLLVHSHPKEYIMAYDIYTRYGPAHYQIHIVPSSAKLQSM
jgi:hypothetical protein